MPLYVADYLADTGNLDHEEHGVYLLAIMHYWQTGKPLPNDKQLLCICRCFASDKFEQIWSRVSVFFTLTEDGWIHKRIEEELKKAENISQKRRLAGSKGGKAAQANAVANDEQLLPQSQSQSHIKPTTGKLDQVAQDSKAKIVELMPHLVELYDVEAAKWIAAREGKTLMDPKLDLMRWMQRARKQKQGKSGDDRFDVEPSSLEERIKGGKK